LLFAFLFGDIDILFDVVVAIVAVCFMFGHIDILFDVVVVVAIVAVCLLVRSY